MEQVVEYQNLLPYQFEQRISACPLAYVPMGSLEWHGEHMAIGNDSIKMHGLCCEAARLGGGIVFPPLFYGILGMTHFAPSYAHDGDLPMPHDLIKALLLETLAALERVGFKAAIVATGHTCGEQCALMREVAADYAGAMKVYGTDDMEWAQDLHFTSDHAAKWETSILWALRPELVDVYRLPRDPQVPLEGVYGEDPRVYASRELGFAAIRAIARDLAAKGLQLLGM
jgi:creatinine amidohydrolase